MSTPQDQPHAVLGGMKGCVGFHPFGYGGGKCDSCHTRRLFSAAEARRPYACATCHRGFLHPRWGFLSILPREAFPWHPGGMEILPAVKGWRGWAVLAARNLLLLAAGLLFLYGGLCAYMFFRQESYVFFPEGTLTATPRTFGMAFENLRLRTSDGVRIHGWFVPRPGARGTLLLFHGNAGTLSDRVDKIRLFHDFGWNVLAVDYRGYGESEGSPSEEGTYADGAAAVAEALRRGEAPDRLVLYGESLGGAVAVQTAGRFSPGALVLESTFTSVPDMARRLYPWLPVSLLVRIRYDSLARIRNLSCPVAVLHSPKDEIVPFDMGRALYKAAPGPKVFLPLRGGHNDGGILASPEAAEGLRRFLEERFPPPRKGT